MRWFAAATAWLLLLQAVPPAARSQPYYYSTGAVWRSGPSTATNDVVVGDVDNDGDLDLFAASYFEKSMLYLNDGHGLQSTSSWTGSQWAACAALGDVDGDGDLDLFLGRDQGGDLFLASGGSFSQNPVWSIWSEGGGVRSVMMADMDGDGDLDIVCGNYRQPNTLYRNEGGTFSSLPAWSAAASDSTFSLAIGDVDGDGDLDLACGNGAWDWSARNTLYLNEGGTLQTTPAWTSTERQSTMGIALGDVDGDGDLDMVCGNYQEAAALYINESGLFQTASSWDTAPIDWVRDVALGDVDGDADLDVVLGCEHHSRLFLNEGGVFSSAPAWSSNVEEWTTSIALADLDGDGDLDLVAGTYAKNDLVFRNEAGLFGTNPSWEAASPYPVNDIALGDVNGNGYLDLVCGVTGHNTLYLNDAGVLATEPAWEAAASATTNAVALGDVDGDGDLDLACGRGSNVAVDSDVLYKNEGGVFKAGPSWTSLIREFTFDVALGDVDDDGDVDVVSGCRVYRNSPSGFIASQPSWSATSPGFMDLADVNRDGSLDLISSDGQRHSLYLNTGGGFPARSDWSGPVAGWFMTDVRLSDVTGDGYPDLACGDEHVNAVHAYEAGAFESVPRWSTDAAGSTRELAFGDVDGDGDLDLVCGTQESWSPGNTLFLNENGVLGTSPAWTTGAWTWTRSVALGDVDRDGDLDLVCGNAQSNTLYAGGAAPAFKGDPMAPTNQLPFNSGFLRSVTVSPAAGKENRYAVRFEVVDTESDPAYVHPEFQFEGEPTWYPADFGVGQPLGPLAASPDGVTHAYEWNISTMPFDSRDVVLRLRTVSLPMRVSVVRHVPAYLIAVGPLTPRRPEIHLSQSALTFPTVTVGDTVSVQMEIRNAGNIPLRVSAIDLLGVAMRHDLALPHQIAPGQGQTVVLYLEPRAADQAAGAIRIASDDPLSPETMVTVSTDVRELEFATKLLGGPQGIPLGEAVTIEATPARDVHIERGWVFYRAAGQAQAYQPLPLVASVDEFIAVIPGEAVTEAGLEYYVVVENSGVTVSDPADAPSSTYLQAVVSPATITTSATPNRGQDFLEGLDIKVHVALPVGASFVRGTLHYRAGGDAGYQQVTIQFGQPLPYGVIPDSIPSARGVEYWAEVQTLTRTLTDPAVTPAENPHGIRVTVPNLREEQAHPGGIYRVVSIPLELSSPMAGVLTDDLGGPDATRWRMFSYVTPFSYLEVPTAAVPTFEPGRGYWLITRDPHQLDTEPAEGLSTSTSAAFALELQPGYNLVGNPFEFPVAWDSIRVDTLAGETLGMLEAEMAVVQPPIGWRGREGYRFDEEILEPFDGYWVKNLTDAPVVLRVLPRAAPPISASPSLVGAVAETDDRAWRLFVRAKCGDQVDAVNILGVDPQAEDAWDPRDRSEPPPSPGPAIALYFPHLRWQSHPGNYAVDLRGGYQALNASAWGSDAGAGDLSGQAWRFDVAGWRDGVREDEPVEIVFEGLSSVPTEALVALVDQRLHRVVDLRKDASYAFFSRDRDFVASEDDARFLLLVGSEAFVEARTEDLPTLPMRTRLHQNRPNPFNPSTAIQYDVGEPGRVLLRVYTLSGALVTTLMDAHHEAGVFEVTWRGVDARGERVSSGVYFYRLEVGARSETRRMVLLD